MNCENAKSYLSIYFDNQLNEELAQEVEEHLASCVDCQNEIAAFERIGDTLRDVEGAPSVDAWQKIESALDKDERVGISPQKSAWSKYAVPTFIAALAASICLAVLFKSLFTETPTIAMRSVDLSPFVQLAATNPELALKTMGEKYKGVEVQPEQAKTMLGYEPAFLHSNPGGMTLVSAKVLTLPGCNCGIGKCTCGPNGCNCIASLCRRADGTELVILEHCKMQVLTFGELPMQSVKSSGQFKVIGQDGALAASWDAIDRKVTALGIKGVAEADELETSTRKYPVSTKGIISSDM
jgi:hypothetical protein